MWKTRFLSQTFCDSCFSAFQMLTWKEQMAYFILWLLTISQERKRERGKKKKGKEEKDKNKLLCSRPASINASTCLLAPKKSHSISCWERDAHLSQHPQEEKTKKQGTKRTLAADRYAKTGSVCRNSKSAWLWRVEATVTWGLQITMCLMTRQVCIQNRGILTETTEVRWMKWPQPLAGLSISGRETL